MATLARYLGLATTVPLGAYAGYLLGRYLDDKLGTHYLQFTCVVLFILGSLFQLIRQLLKESKDS